MRLHDHVTVVLHDVKTTIAASTVLSSPILRFKHWHMVGIELALDVGIAADLDSIHFPLHYGRDLVKHTPEVARTRPHHSLRLSHCSP